MEHKTWATIDKSAWADGPWKDEPDKEQWEDAATGMPCLIVRNRMGALCGYVGVSEGHPLHATGYGDCTAADCTHENYCDYEKRVEGLVDIHGGLTYSDFCVKGPEAETVCHVPGPGEPEPLWWFGFDTAHSGDYCPRDSFYDYYPKRAGEHYRDITYVKGECSRLARQLVALSNRVELRTASTEESE